MLTCYRGPNARNQRFISVNLLYRTCYRLTVFAKTTCTLVPWTKAASFFSTALTKKLDEEEHNNTQSPPTKHIAYHYQQTMKLSTIATSTFLLVASAAADNNSKTAGNLKKRLLEDPMSMPSTEEASDPDKQHWWYKPDPGPTPTHYSNDYM